MTREEMKGLLPVMQAFADGKKIEYSNDGEDWIETETPTWDTDYVYRIKPEPKYRPFKTQEECWNEMRKHLSFGYIYYSDIYNILRISEDGIYYLGDNEIQFITFKEAFDFKFMDNAPFGLKEN